MTWLRQLAALAALASGCTASHAVDPVGRPCNSAQPCGPGTYCDPQTSRCVRSPSPEAGLDAAIDIPPTDGPPDRRLDQIPPDHTVLCTTDPQCDDKNPCTADTCTGGLCQRQPTNEGQPCASNACITGTTCASGACSGGTPLSCPAPSDPCSPYDCDPASGCQVKPKPNGAACDDGLYCTDPDSCSNGKCTGKPRDCTSGAPVCQTGACSETQKACVYSPAGNGSSCSDSNTCTSGTCQAGSCAPPPPTIDTIETNGVNYGTDRMMRLDAQGNVHVAYYLWNVTELKYATNASGSWVIEVVDDIDPDVGAWASLAITSQGTIYIAYFDATQKTVKVATRGSTGWQSAVVDSGDAYVALVVDTLGKLHVAYQQGGGLFLASGSYPPGAAWVKSPLNTLGGTPMVGVRISAALDASGKIHIAHGVGTGTPGSETFQDLCYTTNASGSWVTSTPASGVSGPRGAAPSIALGSSGQVYITHSSDAVKTATSGTLYLTSRVSGTWSTTTIAPGTLSSLLVGSGGGLHVAYRNPVTSELRYATNSGGSWSQLTIDTQGAATGGWASLDHRPDGTLHVTYRFLGGTSNQAFRHATFHGCP